MKNWAKKNTRFLDVVLKLNLTFFILLLAFCIFAFAKGMMDGVTEPGSVALIIPMTMIAAITPLVAILYFALKRQKAAQALIRTIFILLYLFVGLCLWVFTYSAFSGIAERAIFVCMPLILICDLVLVFASSYLED